MIGWEAAALALLTWASIRQFDLIGHGVRAVAGSLAGRAGRSRLSGAEFLHPAGLPITWAWPPRSRRTVVLSGILPTNGTSQTIRGDQDRTGWPTARAR